MQDDKELQQKLHPAMIEGDHDYASVTDKISDVTLKRRTPFHWFIGFGIAFMVAQLLLFTIVWLVTKGIGIWGTNQPVGWAFPIINFVWWIGIGHAGTLISAILLLLNSKMANVDQPFCRGDDALCGGLRRPVSGFSYRPSVACILAVSVSQYDVDLAAVSLAP